MDKTDFSCIAITTTTMADKISAEELGKMKVTELRKALKERGLSLTGSKSELLDRLTAAVQTDEATVETTAIIEDSILDDSVDLSEPSPATKPVIKAQETVEPEVQKVASPESTEQNTEKEVAVSTAALSESERLKKRAERFGVLNEDMKKQLRSERFGGSTTSPKITQTASGAETDVLKKRAERFGQVLSPALSKVDEAEKIRKRKERFGEITAATNNGPSKPKTVKVNTNSAEAEKLKKRAERFGLS